MGAPRVSWHLSVSSTLVLQARRSQLGKIFSYQRSLDQKIVSRLCWAGASDGCLSVRLVVDWRQSNRLGLWTWWSWTGSNRRPQACKARALPAELQPQSCITRLVQENLEVRPVRFDQFVVVEFTTKPLRLSYGVELVGLGGLEPPTSRLSGGRSNHLSYRP